MLGSWRRQDMRALRNLPIMVPGERQTRSACLLHTSYSSQLLLQTRPHATYTGYRGGRSTWPAFLGASDPHRRSQPSSKHLSLPTPPPPPTGRERLNTTKKHARWALLGASRPDLRGRRGRMHVPRLRPHYCRRHGPHRPSHRHATHGQVRPDCLPKICSSQGLYLRLARHLHAPVSRQVYCCQGPGKILPDAEHGGPDGRTGEWVGGRELIPALSTCSVRPSL